MPARFALILTLWWTEAARAQSSGPSEHKIHNIVLYPDKHSWCKTTEIKQIVTYPGCDSVEIDNNVCVGACFSYSIPKSYPTAPGDVTPYCDSCQPQNFTWKEVILKCESADDEEASVEMTKKVQIISNCTCASCHLNVFHHDTHKNSESDAADVPELMGLMMHHKKFQKEELTEDKDSEDESTEKTEKKSEAENMIDIDGESEDKKQEETAGSKEGSQHGHFHVEAGPHHSLILKPDAPLEHHHTLINHHEQHAEDDRESFTDHSNPDFPDQLAVESRKEFLSVPEFIIKEHSMLAEDRREGPHHIKHHHGEKKDRDVLVPGVKIMEEPQVPHTPGLKTMDAPQVPLTPGVKIVEVPHHQLTPAVEGTHVSYMVKAEN